LEPECGVQTEEERDSVLEAMSLSALRFQKGMGISNIEQGMLNLEGTEFCIRYSLFDILRIPTT
jgi:hypothetical protein